MAAVRTALFSRQQPGGVFTVDDLGEHGGNIWFVGSDVSGAEDGAGFGKNPDAPFATLDYAIGKCTANNHDVIYLLPSHSETKSATGSLWAADVAGIHIRGLGRGADRPTFTFSHTGAATTITAASVTLENVVFVAGIDSVTAPLTISGADWTLKDVEFRDTTDIEFVKGPTTTADADRGHVDGFLYRGYKDGNACTIGISLVGCDGCIVENSVFYGEFSTACIDFTTTSCHNVTVRNCTFYNDNVALTKNILDSATSSTWQVHDCFDGKGGYSFSGGSAATVASDDVSGLTTIVGAVTSTQTSDLNGKIGTDAEMNDISLYDLLVGAGPTTAPSAAAAGDDVSLYEVTRHIQEDLLGTASATTTDSINGKLGTDAQMADRSLYDLLVGDGPTTAISGAALTTDVSLYEGVAYLQDSVLGTSTDTTTDTIWGVLGTDAQYADRSLYDLLVGDGPTTAIAGAALTTDVSLYEGLAYLLDDVIGTSTATTTDTIWGVLGTDAELADRSLYDLLVGDGPVTAPTGAAPGNDVSLYEVVRKVYDNQAGSCFWVTKAFTHTAVVSTAADVTGTSSGALVIEEVILDNSQTAMDSAGDGADIDLSVTNATHAISAVFATLDGDGLVTNATFSGTNGDLTTFYPVVLESGKKVQIAAGDENFTSNGEMQVHIRFRRMSTAATVSAA